MFHPCLLIPVYNNRDTLGPLLDRAEALDLTCLVVDDGSDGETKEILRLAALRHAWVHPVFSMRNRGKGAAVKQGLALAQALGFSHAVQIDADGQHAVDEVPRFIEAARKEPLAMILGTPIFGSDVPKARLYGRQVSKVLVYLETLSTAIADPLFGFRVYPVKTAVDLIRDKRIGNRMDFDPDIAVRLFWRGTPVRNLATPVAYPEGGLSHFHMLKDNLRIGWLHTRLLFGMIVRFPRLCWRRMRA